MENFKGFLLKKLLDPDVYLIFDRYREYSVKSVTRDARTCEASRVYQHIENTPLPSQKAVLTVSSNKKQLMSSIINDEEFNAQHTTRNKLVITGSDDVPTEIHKGVVIAREDIATSHEEADNIIAQQAIMCAKEHSRATVVVADNTDVFILFLFHYLNERLTCPMFMISPIQQKPLSDIKVTEQAHRSIIPGLPAAHTLSGCDTVPTYFGIGKGTVLKNLIAAPNLLSLFGCQDAPISDVIDQATKLLAACYGNQVGEETMSNIRYKIWTVKFGNTATSAPKIQALLPTTEAFVENLKRSHLQTGTWKAALSLDPPALDPVESGYVRHEPSKTLLTTTVPDGVTFAPDEIMTLIK